MRKEVAARLGRAKATVVEVGKAVLSRSSLPALRLLVYSADSSFVSVVHNAIRARW